MNEVFMERMSKFSGFGGRPYLKGVFERGGFAFVTDGHILFRLRTGSDKDTVPKEYPTNVEDYIERAIANTTWFRLNRGDYVTHSEAFERKFNELTAVNDRFYCDRYIEVECPHCGESVYWDKAEEKLVEEKSPRRPTDRRDVEYPVCVAFGEDRIPVNFGYLRMTCECFGEDILFGVSKYVENGVRHVFIRSNDNSLYGILMPLKVATDVSLEITIRTEEVLGE